MQTAFGEFSLTGEATPLVPPGTLAGSVATPFGPFNLGQDVAEAVQMQPFIPPAAQQQGMQWWESLIAYGATRAIDNRFGPPQVGGNTQAGSFAGQNGRTYVNTPSAQTAQVRATQAAPATQGPGLLALAAAAAFAFM